MAEGMNTGPAGATISAADQARAVLAAQAQSVGRFQSPESWQSVTQALTAPVTVQLSRQMPLNRPAESILITWLGRITVANANMTAVVPEAPQNLLQQILLTGTHRKFGAIQPYRISGATAFALFHSWQPNACYVQINNVKAANPGVPFLSPFTGNVGTYDVVMVWNLPLGPAMGIGQSAKRDLAAFLFEPADWGDTLQLQMTWGDATALGTPTTAGDVTFSAFGSASGSPTISTFVNYSILGPFANSLDTGVMLRQEQSFTSFITAATTQRISGLQKQITPNIFVKSGTTLAGTTATVVDYATLTDFQLERTQVIVDNKPIKFNQSNITMKAYLDRMFGATMPQGYFALSFVEGQNPLLAFRGDGLAGGSAYELQSDVSTSGATQILGMTQEMILGGPFSPLRPA